MGLWGVRGKVEVEKERKSRGREEQRESVSVVDLFLAES
jgi:hypothetical protein